jgi:hypothetical protein
MSINKYFVATSFNFYLEVNVFLRINAVTTQRYINKIESAIDVKIAGGAGGGVK